MKILHVLFFCFLSDPGKLVKAKLNIWSAAERGNGTISCHIASSGSTKFFCKEKCERAEDVLIKTDGSTAQSGRYSVQYKNGSSGRGIVSVTFTHVIRSDSGQYRCGLGREEKSVPDSYYDFVVRISNDVDKNSGFTRTATEGEKITLGYSNTVYGQRKFFCKNRCKNEGEILIDTTDDKAESGRYSIEYRAGSVFGLYVTITQLTKSDTGEYSCGYGNPLAPDSYYSKDVLVIDASNSPTLTPQTQSPRFTPGISSSDCPDSFLILGVCLSLLGVSLLAVFLLLLYICKMRTNTGMNTRENADDTNRELSATYENWGPISKVQEYQDQTNSAL